MKAIYELIILIMVWIGGLFFFIGMYLEVKEILIAPFDILITPFLFSIVGLVWTIVMIGTITRRYKYQRAEECVLPCDIKSKKVVTE